MSSRRLKVYDSSRIESEGMLARHQEESRRQERREGEAGDYSEMQEVCLTALTGVLQQESSTEHPVLALEEEHDTIPARVVAFIA